MNIDDYLKATDQTLAELARLADMPQRTVHNIGKKGGSCGVVQAELLIEGSKRLPALTRRGVQRQDWHITLEDLAAGARAYLARNG